MDIMDSSEENTRLPFFFLTFSEDGVIIHPATVILIEILRDSSGIVYMKIIYKYFSVGLPDNKQRGKTTYSGSHWAGK